jgi:hypothetical protein
MINFKIEYLETQNLFNEMKSFFFCIRFHLCAPKAKVRSGRIIGSQTRPFIIISIHNKQEIREHIFYLLARCQAVVKNCSTIIDVGLKGRALISSIFLNDKVPSWP